MVSLMYRIQEDKFIKRVEECLLERETREEGGVENK